MLARLSREVEREKEKKAINIASNLDGSTRVMFEISPRDTMRRFINLPAKLRAGNYGSVLTFPETVLPVQCESLHRD